MKSLSEKSSKDIVKKKNVWYSLTKRDIKDLSSEIFGLIEIAYAPIGGHLKFQSERDVENIQVAEIIDIDDDPEADIILFSKETKFGFKRVGVGHDGEKKSKKTYLSKSIKNLQFGAGYEYGEVSDKFAEILLSNGVNVIEDEEVIRKVLKKDIEFVGSIKGKIGNGWYYRKIGGKMKAKILVGNPKV